MNTALARLDRTLPVGSLNELIHQAQQIPLLTKEQEFELARRLYEENDIEAARQLVMSHLRFVIRIARGYSGYGLPVADLVQEGNIGLMKAVKRFNPFMGVRLVSFAVHWIKAEIHEFVIRNWRIVKVATTKAQRKLFFNLRNSKKRLGWFNKDEVDAVAKDLGVSASEVTRMEERLAAMDMGYDEPSTEDSSHIVAPAPVNFLEDTASDPALALESDNSAKLESNLLHKAILKLDARSQEILQTRWFAEKKTTLTELAGKFGVSAERIRQLEKAALNKLKGALEHHLDPTLLSFQNS